MANYELVLLETKEDYAQEGEALRHALAHYYDYFVQHGIIAYSLRKDGKPLLSLSVKKEGFTDHVVGHHNRPPTKDEFAILNPLLAARGIENRYDPNTMH
jgi:hypothetical protein